MTNTSYGSTTATKHISLSGDDTWATTDDHTDTDRRSVEPERRVQKVQVGARAAPAGEASLNAAAVVLTRTLDRNISLKKAHGSTVQVQQTTKDNADRHARALWTLTGIMISKTVIGAKIVTMI